LVSVGPGENGGFTIMEDKINLEDGLSFLKQEFDSALNGKIKYIRTESLSVHQQLLLADYVLSLKPSADSW